MGRGGRSVGERCLPTHLIYSSSTGANRWLPAGFREMSGGSEWERGNGDRPWQRDGRNARLGERDDGCHHVGWNVAPPQRESTWLGHQVVGMILVLPQALRVGLC